MTVQINLFWFPYIIAIIIAFIGFVIPSLLKENIVFGSRFPNEIINHSEVILLKKDFKQIFLTIFIPFLIVLGWFLFNFPVDKYFEYGVITEIILYLFIYIAYNRKAKELKKELLNQENIQPQKGVLVVDTTPRQEKFLISIWWFLPSLLIIISNIFIILLFYNKIPNKIAVHFNLQGTATQLLDKTYLHVMLLPLSSLFTLCIFVAIYFFIKLSKQELNPNKPKTSRLQNMHFRLLWSDYTVLVCTYLIVWMLFVSLYSSKLLITSTNIFEIFNISMLLLFLLSSVILTIKTGQSGTKLKVMLNEPTTGMNNVDDDSYWKLGMFYYNPHDPSIFVEKRYGIGWTINFGRPAGIAIIILIIAASILLGSISKK